MTKKQNVKKVFEIDFDEDIDFKAYFRKTKVGASLCHHVLAQLVLP